MQCNVLIEEKAADVIEPEEPAEEAKDEEGDNYFYL